MAILVDESRVTQLKKGSPARSLLAVLGEASEHLAGRIRKWSVTRARRSALNQQSIQMARAG